MTPNERDDQAVLCYVYKCWAFFTTLKLEDQWGDDWNDAPYEHNAGEPYTHAYKDGELPRVFRVAYDAPYSTPADLSGGNSRYSVEQINKGYVAWLTPDGWSNKPDAKPISAGVTYATFKRLIREGGGTVYEAIP